MRLAAFLEMCSVSLGCGLAAAVGIAGLGLIDLVRARLWPKKPPVRQIVHLCDEAGWPPLRTYRLTADQVKELLGDLDRQDAG